MFSVDLAMSVCLSIHLYVFDIELKFCSRKYLTHIKILIIDANIIIIKRKLLRSSNNSSISANKKVTTIKSIYVVYKNKKKQTRSSIIESISGEYSNK